MPYPAPTENVPKGAPSASTSNRFPDDAKLRQFGWSIHARPNAGPPLWRKGNRIVPLAEALEDRRRQMEKLGN